MSPEGRDHGSILDEKPAFPWISGAALVASNLVPLWFVLFKQCDVYFVLVVFWVENVLVGFFNVLRMAVCKNEFPAPDRSIGEELAGMDIGGKTARGMVRRAALIPFFIGHYGMFTLIHGLFVVVAFSMMLRTEDSPPFPMFQFFIAALALAVSHGVSFFVNYLGRDEHKKTTVQEIMVRPYGRMVVLHVTIVFGGVGISFGQAYLAERGIDVGIIPLLLLIVLKVIYDLSQHVKERKKLAIPLPVARAVDGHDEARAHESRKSVAAPPSAPRPRTRPRARHIVPAVLLGLFGAFLITISVGGLWEYDDVENWVATPCTIIRIEHGKPEPGEEPYYRLWYAYNYKGRTYETDDITIGPYHVDYEMLRRSGDEWQEEDAGTCYVNPRKPTMAFMYPLDNAEARMRRHIWGLIAMGITIISIGACFIAYGFLRRFLTLAGIPVEL